MAERKQQPTGSSDGGEAKARINAAVITCRHTLGEFISACDAIRELLSLAPAAKELDSPDRFQEYFAKETEHLSPKQLDITVRLVNEMVDEIHEHRGDDSAKEPHEAEDDDSPGAGTETPSRDNSNDAAIDKGPGPSNQPAIDDAVAETMNRISRQFFLDQHRPDRLPLLYRAVVVMSTAALERHIGFLFEAFHEAHPDSVSKSAQLSLAELVTHKTIEDAVKEVIQRQKDDFLWLTFDEWDKWFFERFKARFTDFALDAETLKEGMARRNVIVHNDGRVSRQYKREIGAESPAVGARLGLDDDYVRRLLDEITVFGTLLGVHVWTKLGGTDHRPYHFLVDLELPLMIEDRWLAVGALSRQGIKLKIAQTDSDRAVLRVNEWLSEKRLHGVARIERAVRAWDTSAAMTLFRMAKAALLDDMDALRPLVKNLIETEELSMLDVHRWPLLAEYRGDSAYAELIASAEPWRDHEVKPGE